MPNNPVQVVLNSKDYLMVPERHAMGSHRDFFAGQDRAFVDHKRRLERQVAAVEGSLKQSGSKFGVVKVTLRREAWAKSHRPTEVLFPVEKRPCIASAGIGELFYIVEPEDLREIGEDIRKAEEVTRWKKDENTGKQRPTPSARRSEVGAIDDIKVPDAADKREFSAAQAASWLSDPRTGNMYLVEIFAPSGPVREEYVAEVQRTITRVAADAWLQVETLPIRIEGAKRRRFGRLIGVRFSKDRFAQSSATEKSRVNDHQKLLSILEAQVFVRRILLPPILSAATAQSTLTKADPFKLPPHKAGVKYPRIGVVDGGVSPLYGPWLVGSHSPLAPKDKDTHHADFIAGLLVAGQGLNGSKVCCEPDGCELFDIALLPGGHASATFQNYYPRAIVDFMQELSSAVETAARTHHVRVFNMSLNLESSVSSDAYGAVAELLDEIADEHDVLFVLSAGNLRQQEWRSDWPADPAAALKRLAERSASDTLYQPAESARCLSVAALNPPNCGSNVHGAPTCYTRRGPGMLVGIKPDFAHYGGARPNGKKETGLKSLNSPGVIVESLGTSFAAPLVSKTASALESAVLGSLSRDTLVGLLAHLAVVPDALSHESLKEVARHFVGFGVPSSATSMVETPDHEITLVFSDTLLLRHELRFNFAWPQLLVDAGRGACRGKVRLTLAYRPTLDGRFGSEFVRINLDAHLQQEDGGNWRGRLQQQLLPDGDANNEAELIKHGLKWWPLKAYEAEFRRGVGNSSNWRLSVNSILRAGEAFPSEGIPFAVILTISDPRKEEPIFGAMRSYLRSHNVKISDIRTAVQVRART